MEANEPLGFEKGFNKRGQLLARHRHACAVGEWWVKNLVRQEILDIEPVFQIAPFIARQDLDNL